MPRSPLRHHRSRLALRHLCRTLALVAQLFVAFVPLAEGREERLLRAHVEGPRTMPHPGHRAVVCAACSLVGLHGRVEEPQGDVRLLGTSTSLPSTSGPSVCSARTLSYTSRAPPLPQ